MLRLLTFTSCRSTPLARRGFAALLRLSLGFYSLLVSGTGLPSTRPCAAFAAEKELPPAVTAVLENAERLRSGQYRARGRLRSTRWTEKKPDFRRENVTTVEFEESIDADFDFDGDRTSFRRKRVRVGAAGNAAGDAVRVRWYLQAPGQTVELRGTGQVRTAIIHNPAPWTALWPNELSQRHPQPVFDPRSLGWFGWDSLSLSLDEIAGNWFLKNDVRSEDEGGGIHRIESRHQVEEGRMIVATLWCDEQQGWQPVRSSIRWSYTSPTSDAEKRNSQIKPMDESSQSWEKHGDVWVLKTLSLQHRQGAAENDLQLSFDWSNVNQPIPPERFDWKSWNFPGDYQEVEDMRLGGRRGINVTEHRGAPYELDLPVPLEAVREGAARKWLLLVNVAAASLMCGWLARRFLVRR